MKRISDGEINKAYLEGLERGAEIVEGLDIRGPFDVSINKKVARIIRQDYKSMKRVHDKDSDYWPENRGKHED